jgi:hypothetical protein
MNNIFEILKIAKHNDGRIWKDRMILDEKGRISFCQDYDNGRTLSVPIERVEIDENGIGIQH